MHTCGYLKIRKEFLDLKLDLNFIPPLHSNHLQKDKLWRFYFSCDSSQGWLFAIMNPRETLLDAFWYGNMFLSLKSLFCNTVSVSVIPAREEWERGKTGPYAVIIFTFISIFLLQSGCERAQSKGIAIKRNVHLKIKAVEKWCEGSTYRWIEASIRLEMEAEDSQSYNSRCIFIYQSPDL